jgi:hypothetical protein
MKRIFITKQLLLLIVAATIATTGTAQFKKGNLLVETSLGNINLGNYNSSTETSGVTRKYDSKSFSIGLYPRVGFFVTDNVVVGTELSLSFYSSSSNDFNNNGVKTSDSKGSSFDIGLSPFLRYYFNAAKDSKGRFFAQVGGGFSTTASNNYDYNYYSGTTGALTSKFKYNYPKKPYYYNANILVGYNYMVASNVALNLNLGYNYRASNSEYTFTNTTAAGVATTSPTTINKNNSGNIDWRIGFTMFIPRNKKK